MASAAMREQGARYGQRLVENEYVQEKLSDAVENLRAAYSRASKRRVRPTTDEKVRDQLRQAALGLREAADALKTGRTRPKKRRGRRIVVGLALAAGGAAVALGASEELRQKLLGGPSQEPPVAT